MKDQKQKVFGTNPCWLEVTLQPKWYVGKLHNNTQRGRPIFTYSLLMTYICTFKVETVNSYKHGLFPDITSKCVSLRSCPCSS